MAGETLKERTTRLEQILGDWPSEEGTVITWVDRIRNDIDVQRHLLERNDEFSGEHMRNLKAEIQTWREDMESKMQSLAEDVVVLKKAILQGASPATDAPSKVRIPEPKGFSGNRNTKELGNFMWDMEEFFKAAHVPDAEKASLTSMYLMGDAKLWWRTRVGENL